ncbi:MAG: phosphoribosyltransferase [Candidatus Sumerlaeaceae bacterium]|nr:phosphoribosyltransferase [Candidatus Sumerlaeaceae bacterium]
MYGNRVDAGRRLARELQCYAGRGDVTILALPRGGVPVGFEVAQALGAPLDVMVVRKLGVPGQEELALGAIASGGVTLLEWDRAEYLRVPPSAVEAVIEREQRELARREKRFRGDRPPPVLEGRTVILVDDGLATGATMTAAARAVRQLNPARVVIAVPVGAAETCEALAREADEVVCPLKPMMLYAVGNWYDDFEQTTDGEVMELLGRNLESSARAN